MTTLKLSACVSFAFAVAVAGCGSSSSNPDAGSGGNGGQTANGGNGGSSSGSGGVGATGGAGGHASGTGGSGAVNCGNIPSCVANLFTSDCLPTGACVEQIDLTNETFNACYANGVKILESANQTSMMVTVRYQKSNGTACLTEVSGPADANGASSATIANPAGTVVATLSDDGAGNTTITCTGGQPVAITDPGNCGMSMSMSTTCTDGTCP